MLSDVRGLRDVTRLMLEASQGGVATLRELAVVRSVSRCRIEKSARGCKDLDIESEECQMSKDVEKC